MRVLVRKATFLQAKGLMEVMKHLNKTMQGLLLSPKDHAVGKLYGIQDGNGNWYYPETSGFTIGRESTDCEIVGPDNNVYFYGYFPDFAVKDPEKMQFVRDSPNGYKVVKVPMRINPDDVDRARFTDWTKRLAKNIKGFDPETGTYIGTGEELVGSMLEELKERRTQEGEPGI